MLSADHPITTQEVTMTPRQAAELLRRRTATDQDLLSPELASGFVVTIDSDDRELPGAVAILSEYHRRARTQPSA